MLDSSDSDEEESNHSGNGKEKCEKKDRTIKEERDNPKPYMAPAEHICHVH